MTHKHWTSMALSALAVGLSLHAPAALRANGESGFSPTQVDSYLQASMKNWQIPGLAVAVIRNDSLALLRSYGLANVELGVPTSPRTVFEIGALTRQFTAAAVLQLVDAGKISLDQPIRTIMPELPEHWADITVRHLLSHTSGLPSYTSVPGFSLARPLAISQKQVVASVASLPLHFKSGEGWSVRSTDYYLLGMLIERVSGLTYEQFLTDRIFRPLELSSTRVNNYEAVIKDRADGYAWTDQGYTDSLRHEVRTHPTRLFAHGDLVSSAADLARWYTALVTGKVLKAPSLQAMFTPGKLSDGSETPNSFGWRIRSSSAGEPIIEQFGANGGFTSRIVYNRSDGVTVILLANGNGGTLGTMAEGVRRIVVSPSSDVVR